MAKDLVARAAIAAGVGFVRQQLQAGERIVYDDANRPPGTATVFPERSLTRQADAEGCDINVILKRYETNGELPSVVRQGYFADVSEAPPDLQTAMAVVLEAQDAFMTLPARVRARFDNDPQQLLDFLSDPANRQEAVDLKLLEEVKPPVAAPEVPPAA